MTKSRKFLWSLNFLIAINIVVAGIFYQRYGGLDLIPHIDLMAACFWLLLNVFGLLILNFLQLLFRAEGKKERIRDPQKTRQKKPGKKQARKPQKKSVPKKATQKEPGKKQNSDLSKSPVPNADESQDPGKPTKDEAPEIWKQEEFE